MFDELFERMSSNRDRAILAFYKSTAARPDQLLRPFGLAPVQMLGIDAYARLRARASPTESRCPTEFEDPI